MAELNRRVIACNFRVSRAAVRRGALAYVSRPDYGSGHERVVLLIRSRGGRWIHKWEAVKNLTNFRVKTIPPEHPRFEDERLWSAEVDDDLARRLAKRADG